MFLKALGQIAIIFAVCVVGDFISHFLPIPFPGSVIAMVILFFCLLSGAVKLGQIEKTSDFFLQNMAFFFIPATVSIIDYLDTLKSVLLPFIFICLVTTVITFLCTAYAVKGVIYLMNRKNAGGEENIENA